METLSYIDCFAQIATFITRLFGTSITRFFSHFSNENREKDRTKNHFTHMRKSLLLTNINLHHFVPALFAWTEMHHREKISLS